MLRGYKALETVKTGLISRVTPFYFYPLEPEDYIAYLETHSTDTRYPLMAFYYLTHRCWDACPGCFAAHIESPSADQPWDMIERTLKDLAAGGTCAVKFAGRESTVSPHLGAALDLCAETGLKTVLITSGANLREHASSIARSCTHFRVSLNTTDPGAHQRLHRPSKRAQSYMERLRWIEWILCRRDTPGYTHGATFLVRPETIADAIPYAVLCRNLGFHYVRYTVLDQAGGKWPEQWEDVWHQLQALQGNSFQVWLNEPVILPGEVPWWHLPDSLLDPALITRVTIHANGKVNACPEGWRESWGIPSFASFGNLYEESFRSIWCGARRMAFLRHVREVMRVRRTEVCKSGGCKYSHLNRLLRWISWHVVEEADDIVVASIGSGPQGETKGVKRAIGLAPRAVHQQDEEVNC